MYKITWVDPDGSPYHEQKFNRLADAKASLRRGKCVFCQLIRGGLVSLRCLTSTMLMGANLKCYKSSAGLYLHQGWHAILTLDDYSTERTIVTRRPLCTSRLNPHTD